MIKNTDLSCPPIRTCACFDDGLSDNTLIIDERCQKINPISFELNNFLPKDQQVILSEKNHELSSLVAAVDAICLKKVKAR